jgi:hypothetical protein
MKNGGQMNTDGRGTCRGCRLWRPRLFPASRPGGVATRAKSALSHPYRFSPYNKVVHPDEAVIVTAVFRWMYSRLSSLL